MMGGVAEYWGWGQFGFDSRGNVAASPYDDAAPFFEPSAHFCGDLPLATIALLRGAHRDLRGFDPLASRNYARED